MSFLHIELLRGLAMTKLEHLQPAASDAHIVVTSASARALALARLAVTSALVLLCLAGELERLAKEELLEEDSGSVGDRTSTESDFLELLAMEPPDREPVRCRWCREYVMCRPDGEVFDLDENPHVCSLKRSRASRALPRCVADRKRPKSVAASTRARASSGATSPR